MTAQEEPKKSDELLKDNVFARLAMNIVPDNLSGGGTWPMVYAIVTAILALALEIRRMRKYHEYID